MTSANGPSRFLAAFATGAIVAATAVGNAAHAQSVQGADFGAQLGPGYAQMVNLSSSTDFTTARYHVHSPVTNSRIDVTRLPLTGSQFDWSESTVLETRLTAGYLRYGMELPTPALPGGRVDTRWVAYGLSGGVAARVGLERGFTVVPALDIGAAQLENHTSYIGPASALQPVFDGTLFNWRSHAWQVTPSVGVDWLDETLERRLEIRTHLAWSRVASFGESDPALQFRRSVGAASVRFERTSDATWAWFGRPPSWVLLGGHTAFLGPSRGALGFSWVSELGGGLEWPSRNSANSPARIRATLSVLFGAHVRGLTAGIGVEY